MSSAPVGSPTVLILEDHADTREMLSFVFEDAGYCVRAASSVAEALECLREVGSVPAVILSDIVMPAASGVEFIQYLSGNPVFSHIPVIVVTGARLGEVPAGVKVVIQKPVDPHTLVKVAKRVVYSQLENGPAAPQTSERAMVSIDRTSTRTAARRDSLVLG